MTPDSFAVFQTLLKQESGLVVTPDKGYLLEARLTPVARKAGARDLDALAALLRQGRDRRLAAETTEAMTTNESSFFRDTRPFELFAQALLPKLMAARETTRRIRIWSAACSTGQEAYSLAMLLKDQGARLNGWTIEIVGTDICQEVLERARAGIYTQFEVQRGLPITCLVKYFKQAGDRWELSPQIRQMVTYKSFNLLSDPAPLGKFDIVFCRNVLIYFDQPTKKRVLDGIARNLPPDGILFLGGAETVIGITEVFRPAAGQRGTYELAPAGARPAPAPDAASPIRSITDPFQPALPRDPAVSRFIPPITPIPPKELRK